MRKPTEKPNPFLELCALNARETWKIHDKLNEMSDETLAYLLQLSNLDDQLLELEEPND